ncbi:hypothetical protein BDF21DRAFT_249274 [Thamnidium elegans]|nr:hypothetical protein BDF21DRAFT_249274 [Thamnidium elegans]
MFQQSKRKLWRSIQLSNEKRIVRLNMDMEEIRTRMEAYLSNLFHCYVYAENQGSTDTFLFSLAITEKSKDPLVFSDLRFGFMVYFPETNLVISPYYVWLSSYDKYFKEALLETFGAASFIFKAMHVQSIKDVKDLAIYKESKSIFKDIGNKQLDANPLDIRQKRQHVFDDDNDDDDDDNNNDSVKQKRKKTSNESTEQKKRIVPIDIDELEDRIDNLKNSIGWRPMSGHRSLQINLNVPFQPNTELQEHNYADDVVNITIDMEGFNVAEGIRDMIRHGLIELPAPVWLEGVGISGTKNVTVTSDGVFTEEDEEDDRNEPAYRKNPMF